MINWLYEKLESMDYKDFYDIESEFCLAFCSNNRLMKDSIISVFLVVSNWSAASERSGVWTFYESENKEIIMNAVQYLENKGEKEMSDMLSKGINDYQNPKYADSFDFPQEWMEEADEIDSWIEENTDSIRKWLYDYLVANKEYIVNVISSVD